MEKNWRPNVVKLQELGFSIQDISHFISRYPSLFICNNVSMMDFWKGALEYLDNLSVVRRTSRRLLSPCMEKVIATNLSFLQKQLGLDLRQIVRMITHAPFLFTSSPESLMIKVKEAEDLGVDPCSRTFVNALVLVSNLNRRIIDTRLNNLKNLGFSQEEVTTLVSKHPCILRPTEELMGRKVEFLMKEVGCDKVHVVNNPSVLAFSLEKRLIPRNLVRKLLELKGLVANKKFISFAQPTDKQFVKRFVHRHEDAILGLYQAYADACAGNIRGIEWFKGISS